jgi:GxxExxY protein
MIGEYVADLLVKGSLIIELETAKTIAPEREAQIIGYPKSSRLEHGFLTNFGSHKYQIRKFAWAAGMQPQRTQRTQGIL